MADGPRAYSRSSDVRKSPAFEVRTCFANEPYRFDNYCDGRPIELTSLWEQVLKMRRLPSGLDRNALFRELSSRMGYPEWEVRQHALRVLADIAPVLPPADVSTALDSPLLLPSTVNCLGHPSAAVRRAALDALRALLVASEDPDLVVDALVLHGLDGTDPDVAMGVILGIPALLSPRLPHQGMARLVSALARKVIHSAFHEEALDTLSKIRSLVGEGQFDRFLVGFPPKYRRDFRALFRAHDVRSDNEDSSAETRARVKEMLANGILKEVEGQDTKRAKVEPSPANNASGPGRQPKEAKPQPSPPAAAAKTQTTPPAAAASGSVATKPAKQTSKGSASAAKVEAVVEVEEEIDSANGSRPASAETRTEEHSVSEKGEDVTKAEALLKVPEREEEDPSTSENDKASVENVGKGDGGNVTDEEGGELEDDEDSGVEGSGGRGEEGNEGGATSPPPSHAPAIAGRILLETEIQFSEATAITMTILEEADVASKDGDPGRIPGRGRGGCGRHKLMDEEMDPDVAIRVLDSSEEEVLGKIREVGRPSAGRRVRFGGEMVLQTPDSSAETLQVPTRKEDDSATNSSEDQDFLSNPRPTRATESQPKPGNAPFVSHIPVRVDASKRQLKSGDVGGDQGKSKPGGNPVSAPPPPASKSAPPPAPAEEGAAQVAEESVGGTVVEVEREGTRVEVTTEDSAKVKLEAEGTEVELVVQVVGGGEGAQNAAAPEVKPELPIVMPLSSSRVHSWEDLGIVDKQILVDIRNKDDWQARGRGTNILKTALRDPAVSAMLYHHLPEFLLFIEPLLEDRSIPVVTAALGAVRNVASAPAIRPKLSSPAILRRLTASLCRRAAHTHVAIRAAAASAAKALMRAAGPRTVLPPLLTLASAPRAPGHRVRESALILTLHALLAFPSGDFDALDVARRTAPALADPKRRVRQAALECMAVLAQFVPQESLPLSLATERLRSRKARRAMEMGVAARLSRRRLPVVTTDGLILYALQIPPTASRGMPGTPTGADVDWILAGTGSISSGSAMSRGNYAINRSESPLMPTAGAHIPVYKDAPEAPPTLRNRPDSPIAFNHNSPWMDSRRNQSNLAPVAGPVGATDQRSHSAETNNFPHAPLRVSRDANKPASSPSMGTGGGPPVGPVSTSPWSAANRGEGGEGGVRRQVPTLQVASMSSSFSSSTSSNSSASSGASNTSTSNPPTIGYFRPVYNGPRHLGVIEDVVTERGFSILPDKMMPVNPLSTSPGKAAPILGPTCNLQGSRRLRSPSPPSGRRSRRGLAPVQRQSSTDSRPSSPTSNDSSIPPHRSSSAAPLPIHTQTATLAPGRWSGGGERWTPQYVGDTSTTNHDCTSGTLSGQERIFTSDESSPPYRSDSSSGRRPLVMEPDEIPRGRRPMKGESLAVTLVLALEEEDEGSPRFVEITELEDGEKEAVEGAEAEAGVEKEAAEKPQEGAEPGTPTADKADGTDGGVVPEDVDGAAGSALGAALAIVAADGGFGEAEGASASRGGGGSSGEKSAVPTGTPPPSPAGEDRALPPHPCVPDGTTEGVEAKAEEEAGEVAVKGAEGEKGKKGEKEADNEMLKEAGEEAEGKKEEAGEKEGGDEKKDEGKEKRVDGGEGGESTRKEEEVERGGEGGVVVEGRVEGSGSGEGSKGAAMQEAPSVQTEQSDALRPPLSSRESNCGGAALPVDLSVGLLGVDIDEHMGESSVEKGRSFTTLPLELTNSPPPRPKQLSCSYPSGGLHLLPEDFQEDPMSTSFVVPPLNQNKGGDITPTSSAPNAAFGSKHHGQTRNGKIQQQRDGRRSLPNRHGVSKQSINSAASAPSVHPNRSSSTSTSLFPESLPPVKNPKEALRQSFQNMDDPDWEVAMKGLETLVRLIRHHPSYVQAELTRVIATLARQIRNLRSQVARAACQASGELALPRVAPASPTSVASDSSISSTSLLRRALEADLEEVAAPLLHRSADTNRFLRDDCVAALDRFVAGVGPTRVVGPILSKGVTHQNALVRTVTARLLATIVAKLGAERVMTQLNKDVRAKVLRAGANLLMEGSLQTRTYAKQVFRILAAHESFDRALTQSVPTTVLRNIHKTLLAIKKESIASAGADPSWDA